MDLDEGLEVNSSQLIASFAVNCSFYGKENNHLRKKSGKELWKF